MLETNLLDFLKDKCGGVVAVAQKTGLTTRAIYKWTEKDALPRTEYTEETNYSQLLSELSGVPKDEIKLSFKPTSSEIELSNHKSNPTVA